MVLVIAGHFLDYGGEAYTSDFCYAVYVGIYAFHMPLFFFISGLFYKEKSISEKVFYYAATGLLMGAVTFLFQRLLYGTGTLDYANLSGAYWFMLVLAAFTLLRHLLRRIHPAAVLLTAVVVACFAGYSDSIGPFLGVSRILVFFPFYFAGTMLNPQKLSDILDKKAFKITGAALVVLWGVLCGVLFDRVYTLRKLFTAQHPYAHLPEGMAEAGGLYRLLCYVIAALLCFALLALMPRRRLGVVTAAGGKTLQTYFWHLPFIFLIHTLDAGAWFSTPVGLFCALLLCVALALLLSLKPFGFPTEPFRRLAFREKNKEIAKNS